MDAIETTSGRDASGRRGEVVKRYLILAYAAIAYALGLAAIAYLVAFLADFGVPKSVNRGGTDGTLWSSVLIDTSLVLAFGLHHSVTARTSFKRVWKRVVPESVERATYLYMTALMTFALVYLWQPVPVTVWRTESPVVGAAIVTAYLATWAMMVAATFHVGHLEFFGLRQAWDRFGRRPPVASPFSTRCLYALVRHPISLGWMLTPWLTPHMSIGQLLWAVTVTLYVMVATRFEEADLIDSLGDRYKRYRERVPAFVPRRRPWAGAEASSDGRFGLR